ncbi:hypothetical protein KAT92_02740 [Candidatus Babeliales bacterium]|nr:hypothetical protein [Candidatus Babeliales bacterium]
MKYTKLLLITLIVIGGSRGAYGFGFDAPHIDIDPGRLIEEGKKKAGDIVHSAGVVVTDTAKIAAKKAIFQGLRPLAAGGVTEISEAFFITACSQIKSVITDVHDESKANFDMFGNITDDYINLVLNLNYHTREKSSAMNNALKRLISFAERNVRGGVLAPSSWMQKSLGDRISQTKSLTYVAGKGGVGRIDHLLFDLNNRNKEYVALLFSYGIKIGYDAKKFLDEIKAQEWKLRKKDMQERSKRLATKG